MEMAESLEYALGRIEGKLDMILKSRDEDRQGSIVLETRVTSLEKWRWTLFGGACVVSAVVSVLIKGLLWLR